LVSGAMVVFLAAVRRTKQERARAVGLLLFLATVTAFSVALGRGRAQVLLLPEWGGIWPARYCLLAVPALFVVFFIWELYGPAKLRGPLLGTLVVMMIFLLPYNILHGLWWRDWYLQGVEAFERDLRAGLPRTVVVERNREFLFRWMDSSFDKLRMLQEARIGLFAGMSDTPQRDHAAEVRATEPAPAPPKKDMNSSLVALNIRYAMPEADEVFLAWGIDDWHRVSDTHRPPDTRVNNDIMQTPMARDRGVFVASVRVPSGATVNYCFLITKGAFDITWPVCEGEYRDTLLKDTTKEVRSKLTFALVNEEIRYVMPDAEEVYLIWGLNGWHQVPESLFPEGTVVKDRVMQTAMRRNGEAFLATVRIPVCTTLDYGFRITKRRGLFDLVYPVWDGDYRLNPSRDGMIETKGKAKMLPDLSEVVQKPRLWRQVQLVIHPSVR